MNTINIAADATAQRIGIGNQYENEATAVVFDCSQFAEDHGAGTAQIIHRRPTELIGNVCTNVSQTGSTVTWLVTDDDTSFTGKGQVQLRWYVNDVLRESVIFPTYILPSVASSDDAPAEVKSALEQIMEWVNDNTISIEDLDERIANYFDEHPIPTPVTSVNEKLGDVVLTAEDVGAYSAEEADEKFCVPDGEYEELNAGTAKQLLSDTYTLDQIPYLFRKSPDSDRAVEEIVGGTVAWNQLNDNTFSVTNATYSVAGSVISFTASATGGGINKSITYVANHKYLMVVNIKISSGHAYFQWGPSTSLLKYTTKTGEWEELSTIKSIASDADAIGSFPRIRDARESGWDEIQAILIITDLTTMFGTTIADYIYSLETATAGAGVAKLKEWGFFTEDYYEYSEPTLRSVEGLVSKKTVGWNQWDEEWELGSIATQTGAKIVNNNDIRSKNYTKCLPNTSYSGTCSTGNLIAFWYDADYGFIRFDYIKDSAVKVVTSPSNACYFLLRLDNYGKVYNHDICINLSDPTRNGQYEPYESHSYPLDSEVVLRGIPKLDSNNNLYFDGDVYPADGQGKRRYGEYTFTGSETWGFASTFFYFLYDFGELKHSGSCITSNGIVTRLNANPQGLRVYLSDNPQLSSASDMSAFFKSGTKAVYELATPTTFTAQPYHNPQIVGDTEEFVTTGIVPVGHATKYYQNLRKKIEGLPWNFATLIAPTEVTNKATRNYTTGSYLILNNVLYKVTANIANGGIITPNTNCTATTIMAEFMSL